MWGRGVVLAAVIAFLSLRETHTTVGVSLAGSSRRRLLLPGVKQGPPGGLSSRDPLSFGSLQFPR